MAATELRKRLDRALVLYRDGRLEEADALCAAIIGEDPGFADALHLKGVLAGERRDFAGAEALIARAMEIKPGTAAFHHNLAGIYGVLGRFGEAEEHFRQAIRLKPDYPEAYFNMAGSVRFTGGEAEFGAVERLLAGPGGSRGDRCFLHFAAAQMYDDIGEHDRAFEHCEAGNRARRAAADPARDQRHARDSIATFTPARMTAHEGRGHGSRVPVFIVGMPRSGTSLVEQILASHPEAFGAGELVDVLSIAQTLPGHAAKGASYPSCVGAQGPQVFEGFAGSYLGRITALAPAARRIVDKNPLNFEHLGLIALMFPRASIVHCRRHPLDTCVSCYFQNFRKAQEYSFDLGQLARFYRYYHRLMDHWRTVLANPIMELRYEDLVADPLGRTRALLEHCGLDWDDACASPHRTDRPVPTASRWQARQPVYRTSVGRWRHYQRHIGVLRESLGPLVQAYESESRP